MVKNIQNFREFNENQNTFIFESKLSDLYNKFNLKEIKKLLKEKLDIDENTPKLEIAKKLLKFYYKLELKLLKYELGAIWAAGAVLGIYKTYKKNIKI